MKDQSICWEFAGAREEANRTSSNDIRDGLIWQCHGKSYVPPTPQWMALPCSPRTPERLLALSIEPMESHLGDQQMCCLLTVTSRTWYGYWHKWQLFDFVTQKLPVVAWRQMWVAARKKISRTWCKELHLFLERKRFTALIGSLDPKTDETLEQVIRSHKTIEWKASLPTDTRNRPPSAHELEKLSFGFLCSRTLIYSVNTTQASCSVLRMYEQMYLL